MIPLAVDVPRAAMLLGCSEWTIRRLVATRKLPTVPDMGRRVLIPTWALDAHTRRTNPAQEAS